jgi:hypothetical protein
MANGLEKGGHDHVEIGNFRIREGNRCEANLDGGMDLGMGV